jgi:NADPH2:quinone reductase
MLAAYYTQTGPPEVIQYGELPTPTPGPGLVQVKTEAAALNPIDTYIRAGMIPAQLPYPFIPGCDVAGTVTAVGAGVTQLKPGDRVWGSNQGLMGRQGTFAEYVCADAHWLYPLPDGVPAQSAAACSLVGITAHLGLFQYAQLAAGETVYVSGGTGGVGSMVVQMAKAAGARVITTAGDAARAARAKELGADAVILYKEADIAAEVRAFAPEGINVWYETLREPDFERTIPLLTPRGRMIVMAGRDARPSFPLGSFYTRNCRLYGFAMFNATPEEQARAAADINRWLAGGQLRAQIDRVLPLSQAAEAHRLQEASTLHKQGTLAGKIVLVP